MKFKALYSEKQFFGFKGSTYKAQAGIFETEDKEIIDLLDGHFAWQPIGEIKKAEPKKEPVEEPVEEIKEDIIKPKRKKK